MTGRQGRNQPMPNSLVVRPVPFLGTGRLHRMKTIRGS